MSSTDFDDQLLSDARALQTHKQQLQVERWFCFLKDLLFQAHKLFLKNPDQTMIVIKVLLGEKNNGP